MPATLTYGVQKQIHPWELVRELAEFLAVQGIGLTLETNLFIGTLPATPVNATMILSDGGPRIAQDVLSRPHIQIYVRNTHVQSGGAQAALIVDKLDKRAVRTAHFVGWSVADQYTGLYYFNENNHPVHPIGCSYTGKIW